jgi:ABC-type phosphate/phosphonate transport system substrate-binding protein
MPTLIANARMYAVTPTVRAAWRALFSWVSRYSDVPLRYIDHAAPAPLEELWARTDLGATFMCGFPFATAALRPRLVAGPVPSPPRYGRQPVYCTDFVVRADSKFRHLSDVFGARIGWTISHSQSGFNAVRHHLLRYRDGNPERLFAASIGPLVTPRRVIEALLDGTIDVGPLDSYLHDLLSCHEPQTASQLRTVESTVMTPIPPLVASATTAPDIVAQLQQAFVAAASDRVAAAILDRLLLAGFVQVAGADYDRFSIQASQAAAAHYEVPG